jgi:hypothetical protein
MEHLPGFHIDFHGPCLQRLPCYLHYKIFWLIEDIMEGLERSCCSFFCSLNDRIVGGVLSGIEGNCRSSFITYKAAEPMMGK